MSTELANGPATTNTAVTRITVLGVGNVIRTDDGAGIHVLRALAGTLPEHVELADGGTLNFTLLEVISDRDGLIVVDAAQLHAPPGTVRVLQGAAMDRFVARPGAVSVHELSIAELLDMARLRGDLPARRAMVAIQPASLDWGPAPAPALRDAIPEAARRIRALVEEWSR